MVNHSWAHRPWYALDQSIATLASVTTPEPPSTWVAPRSWAYLLGVLIALLAAVLGLPAWLRALAFLGAGLLLIYFALGYAAAARRGETPKHDHDEPPGGWSSAGPMGDF